MAQRRFSVGNNRLEQAFCRGMRVTADAGIACEETQAQHYCVLSALDSGAFDWQWGRLCFCLTLPTDGMCYVYAFASNDKEAEQILHNPKIGLVEKKRYFAENGCLRFVNQSDVLLYALAGRYLWIAIEITGAKGMVSDITVYASEDDFIEAFPEVYRENNSFFHRFLSVYSSLYGDFLERVRHMDKILEIDRAPRQFLVLYLGWLGIDVDSGFPNDEVLRSLLREAWRLIRYKGTPWCLETLCEIFVGEKPVLLERCRMEPYVRGREKAVCDMLYGSSPYDVTMLFEREIEVHRKEQLLHLLEQFQPVCSRLRLVILRSGNMLDGYAYLDKNAVIVTWETGQLDGMSALDETVVFP